MVFGGAVVLSLACLDARVLAWAAPLLAGFIFAVPFAVWTADPALGSFFVRTGLAGIPEDFDPPSEIRTLDRTRAGK
jgi:membrane glycosyltransferase